MAKTTLSPLSPRTAAENVTLPPPCPRRSFDNPSVTRRRSIPFHVLADAFGTVDEELAPEPDWADFPAW